MEALALGGQKVTLTIMATDLRGFTAMSENLSPEEVVAQLNAYHGVMTRCPDLPGVERFLDSLSLTRLGCWRPPHCTVDPEPEPYARIHSMTGSLPALKASQSGSILWSGKTAGRSSSRNL